VSDEINPDKALAKYWLNEISAYDARQKHARWNIWARHAVGVYSTTTGEGRSAESPTDDAPRKRYNIFWSNVENLKPGMYAQTPSVVVSRRHSQSRNLVAKVACDVLENVISYQLSEHGFGSATRAARDDYLIVGRGVSWVRYQPHEVDVQPSELSALDADDGADAKPISTMIEFEETIVDYVHWSDFGHTDARRWEDVRACWRRVMLNREACDNRFGEDVAAKLSYANASVRVDEQMTDLAGKDADSTNGLATIYEVWDAHKRQIIFVSKGMDTPLLTIDDDPLRLPRFFPCSRPIFATLANDDLFAISDYRQYRTQIKQIQDLTKRIDKLTDSVKLVGAYDANVKELESIFNKEDGTLVPVTNWAALAGKGGLDGVISLIPMKEIAETLGILHGERDKALNDSYQLTGISDLIRGDTQASETATAQNIKNQYITMRFNEKKREIDRFVVNTLNIIGAMICSAFSDDSIVKMSGVELFRTPEEKQQCQMAQQQGQQIDADVADMCDRPTWDKVLAFLRDDVTRSVTIDIESDSTVAADQQQNQQHAMQFLEALGGFLKQAVEATQTTPEFAPLMGKILGWAIRQFPIGRDLEESIDAAIDEMDAQVKKQQSQPQPPKPDPEMARVQGMLQIEQAKAQGAMQLAQAKLNGEMQLKSMDMGHQHTSDARDSSNDAEQKLQTDIIIAHINALAKIESARITADANADPDAEVYQEKNGA
jgi:hypothetical protein